MSPIFNSFTSFALRATLLSLLLSNTCNAFSITGTSTSSTSKSTSKSTSMSTSTSTGSRCMNMVLNVHQNSNSNNDSNNDSDNDSDSDSNSKKDHHMMMNRSSFISLTASSILSTIIPLTTIGTTQKANALDDNDDDDVVGQQLLEEQTTTTTIIIEEQISIIEPEPKPKPKPINTRTIEGCPKPTPGKPNNCVATSNIKQLENYSPPWTYEVSTDEAFARLKGLMMNNNNNNESSTSSSSSSSYTIEDIDEDNKYIRATISRGLNAKDTMEFLIKGDDKVVIFKSTEVEGGNGLSDFGANKKRVEDLRLKSGGVFRLMGEGLTADSFDGGTGRFGKRNGFTGQLKAFYGLQSGEGFQSVFEE